MRDLAQTSNGHSRVKTDANTGLRVLEVTPLGQGQFCQPKNCAPSPSPPPPSPPTSTGSCLDLDKGEKSAKGTTCADYTAIPSECGKYDGLSE